jgi:hypothetical protein
MAIFKENCTVKEVTDMNVPLLLLIQSTKSNTTGTSADKVKTAFDAVNIMNFPHSDNVIFTLYFHIIALFYII